MTTFGTLFITPVLPYADDSCDSIDYDGYRSLLRYFNANLPEHLSMGVIANPEAGDIFYLSREEKKKIVEITVEECGDVMPVYAGVAGTSTTDYVATAVDARDAGAVGLFLCPPIGASDVTVSWDAEHYPEVWIDMVKAVAEPVDLPMIIHAVSSVSPRWAQGLPLSAAIEMCSSVEQITGWKMTYSYDALLRMVRGIRAFNERTGRNVASLGASAHWFHDLSAREYMDGAATGSFNYAMEPMLTHLDAWRRDDLAEARGIWNSGLAALHEYIYDEWTRLHIRYKIATWLRGLIESPLLRPPMPKPYKKEIETIRDLLRDAGYDDVRDASLDDRFAQVPR